MLDDERRMLADIEHRLTDVDPMLAVLARQHCAEARRREQRARQLARPAAAPETNLGPRTAEPRAEAANRPGVAVAMTMALIAVVGIALGLWLVVVSGIAVTVTAYLVHRAVTSGRDHH